MYVADAYVVHIATGAQLTSLELENRYERTHRYERQENNQQTNLRITDLQTCLGWCEKKYSLRYGQILVFYPGGI